MFIRVCNNVAGRGTEPFNVDAGTTVAQWVRTNMGASQDVGALSIHINGAKAGPESVIPPDDFVQINAAKLGGAAIWTGGNPGAGNAQPQAQTEPAPAPAPVRRRKTLEDQARANVRALLLNDVRGKVSKTGSELLVQAVHNLAQLDEIRPDQIRDVMALTSSTMEQTRKFAAVCTKEVAAVAAQEDMEPHEVPSTKARIFSATDNQRALIAVYTGLLSIWQLSVAREEPSLLAELLPVPGTPA